MPEASQPPLEKLLPANYPRIDKDHATWYPSLLAWLTAWVARGSLPFQDLQLFFVHFESTLDMPLATTTPTVKLPPESPIVDVTEVGEQEARISQAEASEHTSAAVRPHRSRDANPRWCATGVEWVPHLA